MAGERERSSKASTGILLGCVWGRRLPLSQEVTLPGTWPPPPEQRHLLDSLVHPAHPSG